jgi:hypothetical protein
MFSVRLGTNYIQPPLLLSRDGDNTEADVVDSVIR